MKVYHGKRHSQGSVSVWVNDDGVTRRLEHKVRHSPSGFEWGYRGSGPADLARSLLWDVMGEEPEPEVYQKFKVEMLADLEDDEWTMTEVEILDAVARISRDEEPKPLTDLERELLIQLVDKELERADVSRTELGESSYRRYVEVLGSTRRKLVAGARPEEPVSQSSDDHRP